ncbi:MAG: peptidase S41 [Muribaculaceae bacterium]|nr:peptidase S41 [Muribaculaceae bacterium]
MKRILYFVLCLMAGLLAMAQSAGLTIGQQLEDYDFAVKYIEDNYAGFPDKVVDSTRAAYEAMKYRLRDQVVGGENTAWDALAQYTAWFNDRHLRLQGSFLNEDGHWRGYTNQYWLRQEIYYDELMGEYDPKPVACKVTDKTFLIRFPTCDMELLDLKWVKNSIKLFKKSHCENLIIDIRGNGGGSDAMFNPFLNLFYDHAGTVTGAEIRNTPQNREYQAAHGMPKRLKRILAQNPDVEFFTSNNGILSGGKKTNAVRRAALIIDDGVWSAGEQMVLCMKACSDRVTLYGRDNTGGCLDYSSLAYLKFKYHDAYFSVPMTRRIGLPETSIDKNGIAPDVRIPLPLPVRLTDNIDEWVIWVAEQLEK